MRALSSELSATSKKKVAKLKASARFKKYDKKAQAEELATLTENLLRQQRVEAAWSRIEDSATDLRAGLDEEAVQGLDEAFDNHTLDDDYFSSLARHDGGVVDGWRLLSLEESVAIELGQPTTAELKAIAKVYAKATVDPLSQTWLFAIGKKGRALGFVADFRGHVFELAPNGKSTRVADTYLDWLESLVESVD